MTTPTSRSASTSRPSLRSWPTGWCRYDTAGSNGADVFAAYRIDEQIAKALERKVHLPSGGSLVIDRTEAMTVVDVNTGKYTGSGGNLEETVTKNNLEAAEEMVRQLRLRDIGGIIVIDFIDMVLESNRELVLRRLTEALGRDRTRHQVAEVTSLGLVQMTRKRMGTGLVEAFSEPCPHCGGRGIVLHDLPVVASAIEDNAGDRRPGKGRRGRGRDADRVEETSSRGWSSRSAAGPTRAARSRRSRPAPSAASASSVAVNGTSVRPRSRPRRRPSRRSASTWTTDELDWIEAAASAGIRAAEDADEDEDGFEARRARAIRTAPTRARRDADGRGVLTPADRTSRSSRWRSSSSWTGSSDARPGTRGRRGRRGVPVEPHATGRRGRSGRAAAVADGPPAGRPVRRPRRQSRWTSSSGSRCRRRSGRAAGLGLPGGRFERSLGQRERRTAAAAAANGDADQSPGDRAATAEPVPRRRRRAAAGPRPGPPARPRVPQLPNR